MNSLLDEQIGLPEDKLPQSKLCRFAEDFAEVCNSYGIVPNSFAVWIVLASADVEMEKQSRVPQSTRKRKATPRGRKIKDLKS